MSALRLCVLAALLAAGAAADSPPPAPPAPHTPRDAALLAAGALLRLVDHVLTPAILSQDNDYGTPPVLGSNQCPENCYPFMNSCRC